MKAKTPSFSVEEYDNTNLGSYSNIKTLAFLPSNIGVCGEKVLVRTDKELEQKFGTPNKYNYKYWWNIYNFLQYNVEGIWVYRLFLDDAKNNSIVITGNNVSYNKTDKIYNESLAQKLINNYLLEGDLEVFDKKVSNISDIAVAVAVNNDEYNKSITNEIVPNIRDLNVYKPLQFGVKSNRYRLNLYSETILKNYHHTGGWNELVISNKNGDWTAGQYVYVDIYRNSIQKITNNQYRESQILQIDSQIIKLSGNWTHLTAGDKLSIIDSSSTLTVVSLTYDGSFTFVTISGSTSGLTLQTSVFSSSPTITITLNNYLSTDSTGILVETLFGEWNDLLETDKPVKNSLIDYNGGWFISDEILNSGEYYIENLGKIYNVGISSNQPNEQECLPYEYANSVRKIYTASLYDLKNKVVSFKNIIQETVDFNKYFVLIILKKVDGLFSVVEKKILLKTIDCENTIMNESKYVYLKISPATINNVITTNHSINNLVIKNIDTPDLSDSYLFTPSNQSFLFNKIIKDDSFNIEYILDCPLKENDIYSHNHIEYISKSRTCCTGMIGAWDDEVLLGLMPDEHLNKIVQLYGNNSYGGYLTSHSSTVAILNNMKLQYDHYNKSYVWLSTTGDVVGMMIENETVDPTGVGYNLGIKNCLKLLVDITDSELKNILNYNGINNIIYNSLNQAVVFDSITNEPNLDSVTRELHVRRWNNTISHEIKNILFFYQLKIRSIDRLKEVKRKIESYLKGLIILQSFKLNIIVNSADTSLILSLDYNDILRDIKIVLNVTDSTVEVSEF